MIQIDLGFLLIGFIPIIGGIALLFFLIPEEPKEKIDLDQIH